MRTAADYPPALCVECRRPLDAHGPNAAVVEIERPWWLAESDALLALFAPRLEGLCLVHAQLQCLAAAGVFHPGSSSDAPRSSHGVLRSIDLPTQPARPRVLRRPLSRSESERRSLVAGLKALDVLPSTYNTLHNIYKNTRAKPLHQRRLCMYVNACSRKIQQ